MVIFCCCCNYATVGHIGMRIFNFVVLSVITNAHNVPIPPTPFTPQNPFAYCFT